MATTLSCIPIFYYSKRVIQLYGHSNMIIVSHVTLVLPLPAVLIDRATHSACTASFSCSSCMTSTPSSGLPA